MLSILYNKLKSATHKYEQLPLRYTMVWNGTEVCHGIFMSEWYIYRPLVWQSIQPEPGTTDVWSSCFGSISMVFGKHFPISTHIWLCQSLDRILLLMQGTEVTEPKDNFYIDDILGQNDANEKVCCESHSYQNNHNC